MQLVIENGKIYGRRETIKFERPAAERLDRQNFQPEKTHGCFSLFSKNLRNEFDVCIAHLSRICSILVYSNNMTFASRLIGTSNQSSLQKNSEITQNASFLPYCPPLFSDRPMSKKREKQSVLSGHCMDGIHVRYQGESIPLRERPRRAV